MVIGQPNEEMCLYSNESDLVQYFFIVLYF